MKRSLFLFACCALLFVMISQPAYSQQPVSLRNTHERVLCIVPMIGRGTEDDPRRPLFAPTEAERATERAVQQVSEETAAGTRRGIIAYAFQESEDGKTALVEFVALDREALAPILESKRADVQVFVRGQARKAEVEAAFRQYKRNFDSDQFRVNVP